MIKSLDGLSNLFNGTCLIIVSIKRFFTLERGNEVTINYEKQVNWILSYQVLIP